MNNLDKLTISDDVENELNFISNGILSIYIGDKLFFFYISGQEELGIVNDSNALSLEADAILRDEFPSVRLIFTFYLDGIKMKTIDHFFSIESNEELKHLQQLYYDRQLTLILYDNSIRFIKKYNISNNDLKSIRQVIDEINT